MRVCQITASMDRSVGGPPNVIAGSSLELVRSGGHVEVCTMTRRSRIFDPLSEWPELVDAGIIMRPFQRDVDLLPYSSRLENFLVDNRHRFDVFHFHGVWDLSLVNSIKKLQGLGCKIFISVHGMLDPWSLGRSKLRKRLALKFLGIKSALTRVNGVIFATQEEARLAEIALHTTLPIRIIPNGVDARLELKKQHDGRKFLEQLVPGVVEYRFVLLFCARIHPKKGLLETVKAFQKLRDDHPEWCFVVAGLPEDVEYENTIRSYINEYNLTGSVFLTKEISGVSCSYAYAGSDALVQVSFQEGFSLTVLEAMRYGNPVVISDRCHMSVVSDENCGLVVGNSVSDICDGLRAIMRLDSSQYRAMSQNAKDLVVQHFSWEKVANDLTDVYENHDPAVNGSLR